MNTTITIEEVEPEFKPVKVTVTVLLTSKEELQDLANEEGKVIHGIVYGITDRAKGMILERIRDAANPPVVLAEEKDLGFHLGGRAVPDKDVLVVKTMGSRRIRPKSERIRAFNRRVKSREQVVVDRAGAAPSPVWTDDEISAQIMRNKFPNHGDGGYGEVFKEAEFCPIA
jgi:hypothetical protein